MEKAAKNNLLIALAALVLLGAAAACCVCIASLPLTRVLLGCVFCLLVLLIAALCSALRASLRRTLYTYGNIALIAGILFTGVLAIALLAYFFSSFGMGELSLHALLQALLRFPRHFSFYALFVILAVSLLVGVSNVALIRHEGFCLNNALSLLIAAFYIGGTLLVYLISHLLTKYVFIPRGISTDPLFIVLSTTIPLFCLLMLCYFECILAGTAVMGYLAARQKPAYDKDYIIILGCSIDKRGGLLPLLKGRVNRAVRFAWEQEIATGKPLHYVPSGGQGPNEIMSEGSAMELYLLSHGAEDYEVFPEKRSVNTWENMCFSKAIIEGLKPDAKVAFATTNYHMLRSGILARKAGLDAEGIAGDTKWYFWPNGFVREFFGILTLSIRTHVTVAAVTALVCALLGCAEYFLAIL